MIIALAMLVSAGAAAAAIGRGGVTESRGVTGEPTREFRAPPRKPRAARVTKSKADSALAASVRDSVALLLGGPPPVQEYPTSESPEVNVPARKSRLDPLATQIRQMLPSSPPSTRQAPDTGRH